MSGSVDNLNFTPTQVQAIAIVQNSLRHTLKNPISVNIKLFRKIAGFFCQIVLHNLQGYRKSFGQPPLLRLMHGNIVKMPMSADMIPMDMSRYHQDGQVRQTVYDLSDV